MKIIVWAKPGAKFAKIEKVAENEYRISVKEPARENRANEAIFRALADFFGAPTSSIKLISGAASRKKIFELEI